MTAREIFAMAMAIADEINDSGSIDGNTTTNFQARTPGILNVLQRQFIYDSRYTKIHKIIKSKPLVVLSNFDLLNYTSEDKTVEGSGKAYGYAFTPVANGTVYIEDYTGIWNTLDTISAVSGVESTGSVTPTSGATKSRIRLSGTYAFSVMNYALYGANYETVPSFASRIAYDMPSDFNSIKDIVSDNEGEYSTEKPYNIENDNKLYVEWDYEGIIRVEYVPVPALLTGIDDSLDIDDRIASSVLVYGLVAELFKEENDDIYKHANQEYNKAYALNQQPSADGEGKVYDVYNGNEEFHW